MLATAMSMNFIPVPTCTGAALPDQQYAALSTASPHGPRVAKRRHVTLPAMRVGVGPYTPPQQNPAPSPRRPQRIGVLDSMTAID